MERILYKYIKKIELKMRKENSNMKNELKLYDEFKYKKLVKEKEYKKNIYRKCDNILSELNELHNVVTNPIDLIKIKYYIKKISNLKKKYYIPSDLELILKRHSDVKTVKY